MPYTNKLRRVAIAALAVFACAQPAAASHGHRQISLPCVQGVTCRPAAHVCANASALPAPGNLAKIERATLCLLNKQRTAHHLGRLHLSRSLRAVARKYARLMVRQTFFDHVSPSGSTFVQRIQRTAYLHDANGWFLGENLAWGSGPLATPRQIVKAWMHSPEHRR